MGVKSRGLGGRRWRGPGARPRRPGMAGWCRDGDQHWGPPKLREPRPRVIGPRVLGAGHRGGQAGPGPGPARHNASPWQPPRPAGLRAEPGRAADRTGLGRAGAGAAGRSSRGLARWVGAGRGRARQAGAFPGSALARGARARTPGRGSVRRRPPWDEGLGRRWGGSGSRGCPWLPWVPPASMGAPGFHGCPLPPTQALSWASPGPRSPRLVQTAASQAASIAAPLGTQPVLARKKGGVKTERENKRTHSSGCGQTNGSGEPNGWERGVT